MNGVLPGPARSKPAARSPVLARLRPNQVRIVNERVGGGWSSMPESWSGEAAPGDYVMRKPDSAMDRPTIEPEGMVIANLEPCEHPDEGPDRILVLFFR